MKYGKSFIKEKKNQKYVHAYILGPVQQETAQHQQHTNNSGNCYSKILPGHTKWQVESGSLSPQMLSSPPLLSRLSDVWFSTIFHPYLCICGYCIKVNGRRATERHCGGCETSVNGRRATERYCGGCETSVDGDTWNVALCSVLSRRFFQPCSSFPALLWHLK